MQCICGHHLDIDILTKPPKDRHSDQHRRSINKRIIDRKSQFFIDCTLLVHKRRQFGQQHLPYSDRLHSTRERRRWCEELYRVAVPVGLGI